jgi:nitric oxide reductase large subunit
MPPLVIQISGILLASGLILSAFVSWIVLIRGKFKSWYILPHEAKENTAKAKLWFVLQSLMLVVAAFIVSLRTVQLLDGHRDNVIEQLFLGVSGMLFVRALGEFKAMGLFRSEDCGDFTRLDRRLLTPLSLVFFIISWPLL